MNISIDKILSSIPHSVKDPLFILKRNGDIFYVNNQGKELFSIIEPAGNINDYLNKETGNRFNLLLEELIDQNESLNAEEFDIKLKNGAKLKSKVILNTIKEEDGFYITCNFIPINYKIDYKEKVKFGMKDIDLFQLIRDSKVMEILQKVETLLPLTFIGNEIAHKLVNTTDELFWIIDNEGKFIIVNDKFAESIGLKPFQLEGKLAEEFVPGYIKELNSTIEKFMKNTLSSIVTEGILFKEVKEQADKEIIQFPLLDTENKIRAIVGVSQLKESDHRLKQKDNIFDILYKIIDYFPKPVAFITSDGTIQHSSSEFSKLLNRNVNEVNGLNFVNILPETLSDGINRFITSTDVQRILPGSSQLELEKKVDPEYTIYLTKFFSGENQLEGFSIVIEKIEYAENIQHLIKSRGRMFEFLVKNNPEPIYIYDKENLNFIEVNKAAQDLYKYSIEEFKQMDLTDLYNPEDIQTLLGFSSEQPAEGKFSKPFRQKRKDGSTILVEVSKFSFKYNDREAHFNIVKNVTDSLELEKNIQLFKAAFDNSANLIFVTDPEGIIKFVNASAVNILKISKQEFENSSFASYANDEDRTTINISIFQSHLKESVSMIVQLKSADNNFIETEITATPVLDFESNVDSFVVIGKVVVDITSDTVPKEVIKEVIVEKPQKTVSDESNQLESAFLSGVFHEILTPMNVILGFAQELTEGIDNLTPDQKEAVEIINQNRGKLLSTMNAIIEYSEVQKKKDEWDITEITITKVVETLDKYIYEIIGSREIQFSYGKISSSLQFFTDKTKFDCLLNSLIRLVSSLCKDNKIYFSSYPVDEDHFTIMLTDGYASASDYLANTLKKLFIDKKAAKEIGVSKLGARISISLLQLLQGKFITSVDDTGKYECGFIFPIKLQKSLPVETGSIVEERIPDVQESVTPIEVNEEPMPEVQKTVASIEPEEEPVHEEFPSQSDSGIEIEEETEVPEQQMDTFIPDNIEIPEEKNVVQENVEVPDIQEQPKFSLPEIEEPVDEPEPILEKIEKPEEEPVNSKVKEYSFEETTSQKFQSLQDKLELSGLSCLYIEDQVDSQILYKVQMKGLKNIKYAVSFEEAIPLLDAEHFDFIVMDINLQGEYNGLDALKIIHKMPGYEDVPIIAVTAYVLPGDKEKFIATGFNDFIPKPIFREKMVESLEKIFLQKV